MLEGLSKNTSYNLYSKVITKNEIEAMQALGQELAQHLNTIHPEELRKIALLQVHFNGFNVMKFFEAEKDDSTYEIEKEKMRDTLIEEVMFAAPDEDDEEFGDEEDETDDEDDDLFPEDDEDEDSDEDEEDTLEVKVISPATLSSQETKIAPIG